MRENLFTKFKLFSDENIPKKVTELLREEGYDIKRSPFGIDDKDITKILKKESRILLTLDTDFINKIKFPPQDLYGIIFISIQPPLIDVVFSSLKKLLEEISPLECKGKVMILSRDGYRFKQ